MECFSMHLCYKWYPKLESFAPQTFLWNMAEPLLWKASSKVLQQQIWSFFLTVYSRIPPHYPKNNYFVHSKCMYTNRKTVCSLVLNLMCHELILVRAELPFLPGLIESRAWIISKNVDICWYLLTRLDPTNSRGNNQRKSAAAQF